jgi:hypothetical protein
MHQPVESDCSPNKSADDMLASSVNPPDRIEEEIEVLEQRIALLEEGLPQAPGAQRAALAKEIGECREALDAKHRALSPQHEARIEA